MTTESFNRPDCLPSDFRETNNHTAWMVGPEHSARYHGYDYLWQTSFEVIRLHDHHGARFCCYQVRMGEQNKNFLTAKNRQITSANDKEIFFSGDAWIAFLTLTFLEIVLGVDNIIFISISLMVALLNMRLRKKGEPVHLTKKLAEQSAG